MNEQPHRAILNREEVIAHAEQHLGQQAELLRDIVNYGSNLIIRAFNSSPKQVADIVVCGVLLKQIVLMTDATEVLLSSGCSNAAFLPTRTAFEASIYLDWILDENSELRAKRFIVKNYRDEQLWAKRAMPETSEAEYISQVASQLGFDIHQGRPQLVEEAKSHFAEIARILNQPELKAINQEFTEVKRRKGRECEWYELDGLKSIKQVARKVGRLPEYEFFYSKCSEVVHTRRYKDHFRFSDEQVRFIPIRHLEEADFLINFIASIAIRTFQKILGKYRDAELAAFGNKYLADWRNAYLNIKKIKYNF